MISFLRGQVREKLKHALVIETAGGVGYEVHMTAIQLGSYTTLQEVALHTYLKVSDSALDLYGFGTANEREFFTLLMTVSGVGPKTAMNILALGSIDKIQGAIGRGDVKYLTGVSGLGKKTAERLVVELKGKIENYEIGKLGASGESDVLSEVIEALVGMGYTREQAKEAVESIATDGNAEGQTTEQILRRTLQRI
ncbi:MAG: Holliday junction branch migration protein RuvA [Patescibacteria group bacterium]